MSREKEFLQTFIRIAIHGIASVGYWELTSNKKIDNQRMQNEKLLVCLRRQFRLDCTIVIDCQPAKLATKDYSRYLYKRTPTRPSPKQQAILPNAPFHPKQGKLCYAIQVHRRQKDEGKLSFPGQGKLYHAYPNALSCSSPVAQRLKRG